MKYLYSSAAITSKVLSAFVLTLTILLALSPNNVNAQCTPQTLPYFQTFDAAGLPACWTQEATDDDFDWLSNTGATPTANTGPTTDVFNYGRYMYVNAAANSPGEIASLISPEIAVGTGATATFRYHMWGVQMGKLDFEVESPAGSGNWVNIWAQQGNKGQQWQSASVSLAAFAGQTVRFQFVAELGAGNESDIAIDLFQVRTTVCPVPTFAQVSNVNISTATFSFTTNGGSSFIVEYGPSGFTPGAGTTVNNASGTVNLTGLAAGTAYDVYVKASCATATPNAGPYNFTTPSCDLPVVTLGAVTNNSVVINWTASLATAFDIWIGPAGGTPGTPTAAGLTGNTYTATGLSRLTNYEVYMRGDCSGIGAGLSTWVGPIAFSTPCGYPCDVALTPASAFTTSFVTAGAGSVIVYNKGSINNHSRKTQIIYTKAELNLAGIVGPQEIESLSWFVVQDLSTTIADYTIKMGQTTTFFTTTAFLTTPLTTVFENTVTPLSTPLATINTWVAFPFNAPFSWDGTSNLIVEVCHPAVAGTQAGGTVRQFNGSFGSLRSASVLTTNQCNVTTGGSNGGNRPWVKFDLQGGGSGIVNQESNTNTGGGSTVAVLNYYTTLANARRKTQIIYTKAELESMGVSGFQEISSLGFYVNQDMNTTLNDYTIKLGNTAAASLGGTAYLTGLTTVYNANVGPFGNTGWRMFNFSTPFIWNGTDNLVVEVCHASSAPGLVAAGTVFQYLGDALSIRSSVSTTIDQCPLITGGSNASNKPLVQFVFNGPPSCIPVTGLAVSSFTGSTVTLSYTPGNSANYEIQYGPAGFALGAGTTISVSSTNPTISGLTGPATYDFYVRTSCGAGDFSVWSAPVSATLPCSSLPCDFQVGQGTSTSTLFPINTCFGFNYSQQIYYQSELGLNGAISKIRFFYQSGGTNFTLWNNWTVYMGHTSKTSFSSTTDWIPLSNLQQVFSGIINPVAGGWMEIVLDVPFVFNNTDNLVIAIDENIPSFSCTAVWRSFSTGPNRGIVYYSDGTNPDPASPPTANVAPNANIAQIQFEIIAPPSCFAPSGYSTSGLSISGATVNWTAPTPAPGIGYEYELRTSGAVGSGATGLIEDGVFAAAATSQVFSGLNNSQPYTLYVRSVCTAGDTSTWSSFTFSLPTYCASNATITADTKIASVTLGTTTVTSPVGTGNCATYTNYTNLPAIPLAYGVSYPISVQRGTCGLDYPSYYKVWIDFNADLTFSSNELIYEGSYTNIPNPPATIGTFIRPGVPSIVGETRMRVVLVESGSTTSVVPCGTYSWGETQDFLVDLLPPPPCQVTNVAFANLTDNSVDITWTPTTSGIGALIIATPANSSLPTLSFSTSSLGSFSITGLTGNSNYTVTVQELCAPSDTGAAAGVNFKTLCGSYTAPYYEGFDDWNIASGSGMSDCWGRIVTSPATLNVSRTTSAQFISSGFGYVLLSNSSSTNELILVSPNFSDLNQGRYVNINARSSVAAPTNTLTVGTMSDPNDPSTFVAVQTLSGLTSNWKPYTIVLDNVTAGHNYVAIRHGNQSTFQTFYIETFYYGELENCPAPSSLAVNPSVNSLDLSWSGSGQGTYQIAYDTVPAAEGLIITGIMSGPLTGGLPKMVELYASSDIQNLGEYSIFLNANGATTSPTLTGISYLPSVSLKAGDFYYVTYNASSTIENTGFESWFGFRQDAMLFTPLNFNGDDVVTIYKNFQVHDRFGTLGQQPAAGTSWNYATGWGYCTTARQPNGGNFDIANWTFGSVSGETSNATASQPMPVGTYVGGAAAGTSGTIISGISGSSTTISGLAASETYYFRVREICAAGDTSSWSSALAATTLTCLPADKCFYTVYTYDSYDDSWNGGYVRVFENGNQIAQIERPSNVGCGWYPIQFSACDGAVLTFTYNQGSFAQEASWVITDPIGDTLGVWAGTSTFGTCGLVGVTGLAHPANDVVFLTDTNNCPACFRPSALQVSNVFDVTATASWVTGASNQWDLALGAPGFTPGTPTVVATSSNPYNFTALTPNTNYELYVRDNCGSNGNSPWFGPVAFSTGACPPVLVTAYPYGEDFDTTTVLQVPCGWDFVDANNDGIEWEVLKRKSLANSDDRSVRIEYNANAAMNDWLFAPQMAMGAYQSFDVKFKYRTRSQFFVEKLNLTFGNAKTPAGQSQTLWQGTNLTNNYYDSVTVTFRPTTAGNYYVGFHGISNANQFALYIDDFEIRETPCPAPYNIVIGTLNYTTAQVSWSGFGTNYIVEYGPTGFTPGTGTTVNVTGTSTTLTGLNVGFNYQVYVYQNCQAAAKGVSLAEGPTPFATRCPELLVTYPQLCIDNGPFTLYGGTPAGGTYSGPGVSGGVFNPAVAGAGTHTITYTIAGTNACPVPTTTTIKVNPLPNPTLVPFGNVCIGVTPYTITNGNPQGGVYSGPGVVGGTVFNPVLAGLGPHTLVYTYTDANGCVRSISGPINVTPLPTTTLATQASVCGTLGGPVALTGGAPAGGTYSGPGVINNMFHPDIAGIGIHQITYTYSLGPGCSTSATRNKQVYSVPAPNAGPDFSILYGTNGQIVTTVTGGSGLYSFSWSPADSLINPNAQSPFTKNLEVVNTFTVAVTDLQSGCIGYDTITVNITGGPLFLQNSGDVTICLGQSATLYALPTGGTENYQYFWTPSTYLSNPNDSLVIATPPVTTTYQILLFDGFNYRTNYVTVNVLPIPSVGLNNFNALCADASAFTLTGGQPAGGTYSGVGVSGGMFDPAVAGVGTHTITYTFTNAQGCSNSASKTITIHPMPSVEMANFADVCLDNGPIALTNGSPFGGSYSGNGVSNGVFYPSVAGVGMHTITYSYVNANGCGGTASKTIEVNDLPTVSMSSLASVCVSAAPIVLSGGTPMGGTYSGNGVSNGEFIPALAGVGVHTITYSYADANGCARSATGTVTVTPIPSVNLANFASVCVNSSSMALSGGNPAGGTYSGPGVSAGMFNPTAAGVGSHTITYTYLDAQGCSNSASKSITVLALPTLTFGSIANVCQGSAEFTLSTAFPLGGSYSGTGVSNGKFNPVTAGVGTHTITYTFTNAAGCTNTATQTVTVNALPTVSFATLNAVCASAAPFALTGGNPTGGNYTGPGVSAGIFHPSQAGPGTHTITYTYTDVNGCSNSATRTIVVNALPVVNVAPVPNQCANSGNLTLNFGTPTGGTYSGPGVSGTTFSPLTAGAGNHILTYSVTNANGCSSSTTFTIVVSQAPTVTMGAVSPLCITGAPVQLLTGQPGGGTYSGTGVSGGVFNPQTAGVGNHTVTYTFTNAAGCTATATQTISVVALPVVNLNNYAAVCKDAPAFTLSGGTPAGGVYSGPGVFNGMFYPSIVAPGTYSITYTYTSAAGCVNTDAGSITVNPLPAQPFITQVSTVLTANSIGGVSYQWLDANQNPIPGATAQTYTATGNGVFYVQITDANGCSSTSARFIVDFTGIEEELANGMDVQIYPNPNNGVFTLDILGAYGQEIGVTITDAVGKVVQKFDIPVDNMDKLSRTIDLSGYSKGVYLITVNTDNRMINKKVVVQ